MLARLDLTRLESAYAKFRDRLGPERSECFEAALVVEQLRSLWRPDRVRIVLLAESHVWTSREEAASRVLHPDGDVTGFARFIYCLGGGEPTLVTPAVFPNHGATQNWKLLHDTVRGPNQSHAGVMKGGEINAAKRIENKLELLDAVRQAGIWLVDASISALYRAGNRLAAGGVYDGLLHDCWTSYVGGIICASAPRRVVVIGKQVDVAIGTMLRHDLGAGVDVKVVHQPNARMTTVQLARYRQQIFDICQII